MTKQYSQGDEQNAIEQFFTGKPVGRFLDVGAYDGRTFSNTLRLVELGWSGVCVEASPKAHLNLVLTHKDRPQVECILAAMTLDQDGPVQLWETDDALSTLVEEHYNKWSSYGGFERVTVEGVSARTFLQRHPGPFEFVNVDVEGFSVDLAKILPLAELGTKLLCVEHDGKYNDLVQHFQGWVVVRYTQENLLLGRP